jgi:GNAT superfamily N-acetyltransferase
LDSFGFGAHPGGVAVRLPVVHTIELTLLAADRFPDDWFLMTVWVDGAAVGAALQTPPYPLACNGIPLNAVDSVVADLAGLRPGLDGVRGVRNTAAAFDNSWHDVTGRTGTVNSEERLYRLGELRAPAAGVSRIGPVFTPLAERGHGYGSAVTAAAADLAGRSGTPDVVLFADLANPTSNAIYQRIGFEPVVDSVRIDFVTLG